MSWRAGIVAALGAYGAIAVAQPAPPPTPGSPPPTPSPVPTDTGEPYDGTGRRDPFRPFFLDIRPEAAVVQTTPLQRYELGQLVVVGTIWQAAAPRAMVEDSVGMGYIVGIGTPIGRHGGVVTAIEPQRIVVEERLVDFYGNEQVNRVVMETPHDDASKPVGRERK